MSEMVEVQTSELIGPALDWAVAKIEEVKLSQSSWSYQLRTSGGVTTPHGGKYNPSTNWSQIGPLIKKYRITLDARESDWQARIWSDDLGEFVEIGRQGAYCLEPEIAACRVLVKFKLGDTVMVPKELVQ